MSILSQGDIGDNPDGEPPVILDEALKFLKVVHPDTKHFTILTIDGARIVRPIKFIQNSDEIAPAVIECVDAQVAQKAIGVYFSLGEFVHRPQKRGREHEVHRVRCVWSDLDIPDKERALDVVEEFHRRTGLWPSIIVDSGGGLQLYWLFDEPVVVGPWADGDPYPANAIRVRAINFALARMLGGDDVGDLSRIFRLVGTFNTKAHYDVPPRCRILVMESELRYTLEDLEKIVTAEDRAKANKSALKSAEKTASNQITDGDLPAGFESALERDPKLLEYLHDREMNESDADFRILMHVGDTYLRWANKHDLRLILIERRRHVDSRGKIDRDDYIERTVQSVIDKLDEKARSGGCFDKRRFLPQVLAGAIMRHEVFLTSPIDTSGKGVVLHVYRGGVFRRDGEDIARQISFEMLGREARPEYIESAIALIKEATKRPAKDLNPHALRLVNVENGMLDWQPEELLPHSPEYVSTIRIHAVYDPAARSDVLDRFLATTVPPDILPLLEEMLGYLIIPDTRFHAAFIFTGLGENGKSKLLEMIRSFLGKENTSSVSLHELAENRFRVAELHGKLACIYADLDNRAVKNSGLFKLLTAGDTIQGERKYGHPFDFQSFARLVFSANEIPLCPDRSKAFLRRLLVIPFPYTFDGSDPSRIADPGLGEKLATAEVRSALLNMALRGLRRLMAQGRFAIPAVVTEAIDGFRAKNDSGVSFIGERLLLGGPDDRLSKDEIWAEYKADCERSGIPPLNRREFNDRMEEILHAGEGTITVGGHRVRAWVGVKWLEA